MATKRVFETGCEFNRLASSAINAQSNSTNIEGVTTIQKRTNEDTILMNADTTDINGKKYIASSSGTPVDDAYKAFDQNISKKWSSEAQYTGNYDGAVSTTLDTGAFTGEYIQIQYPESVKIKSYSITPFIDVIHEDNVNSSLSTAATLRVANIGGTNYAFVCNLGQTFYSVDIDDPTNLTLTDSISVNTGADNNKMDIDSSYAYVFGGGSENRMTIVNITDPTNLSLESQTVNSGTYNNVFGVVVDGNYVYNGDDQNNLVSSTDISTPSSPGTPNTVVDATRLAQPRCMAKSGNFLYIGCEGARITVVDVSTPTSPTVDTDKSITTSGISPKSIIIDGNYLYAGGQFDRGLEIFDISVEPISSVGSVSFANNGEGVGITKMNDFVFVSLTSDYIITVDVSDVTNPIVVQELNDGTNLNTAQEIAYIDNYLFVAVRSGANGLSSWTLESNNSPRIFKLAYSSDNSTWIEADSQTAITWTNQEPQIFSLNVEITALYFRLIINSVGDGSTLGTQCDITNFILNTDARGQHWILASTVSATGNTTPSLTLTADGKMGLSSDQDGTDNTQYTYDGGITWFNGPNGGKRQHSFNHNGTIAIRGDQGDGMSRSLDGGVTWASVTTPGVSATDVRSCAIARRSNFAFAQNANNAAVSLDSGDNFILVSTSQNVIAQNGIKCSDDGKYILVSSEFGPYRSNDYGKTWTIVENISVSNGYSEYTDVSGTGQYQIYNTIFVIKISKDYGETFVTSTSYSASTARASIISRDGSFIVVTENAITNIIHLSYDFGDTWTTKILPGSISSWQGLAMSDYGNIIIASSESPVQYAYCHVYNNEKKLVNGVMTIPQKRDNPTLTHSFADASSEVLANLMFGTGVCRAFKAYITVFIDATIDVCENFILSGINRSLAGDDWVLTYTSTGDDTNMNFTISAAGQVSYSHTTVAGFSTGTISSRSESIDI